MSLQTFLMRAKASDRHFQLRLGEPGTCQRREAAGRRNYPEAVPNGKGETEETCQNKTYRCLGRKPGAQDASRAHRVRCHLDVMRVSAIRGISYCKSRSSSRNRLRPDWVGSFSPSFASRAEKHFARYSKSLKSVESFCNLRSSRM
jgi:hypothetical protein